MELAKSKSSSDANINKIYNHFLEKRSTLVRKPKKKKLRNEKKLVCFRGYPVISALFEFSYEISTSFSNLEKLGNLAKYKSESIKVLADKAGICPPAHIE